MRRGGGRGHDSTIRLCLLVAALTATACATTPRTPPIESSPLVPGTAVAAPLATTSPTPAPLHTTNVATVVVYSPPPSASTQAVSAATVADESLPFRQVAVATEPLRLHSDQAGVALSGPGGWAALHGNRFVPSCLPDDSWLLRGAQRWLTLRLHPYSACPNAPQLLRWSGNRWALSRGLRVHDLIASPWRRGQTLAVEVPYRSGPPWGYALRVLEGGRAPTPRRGGFEEGSGYRSECYTHLQSPEALFAFASGEVMVVGAGECPSNGGPARVVVERWGQRGSSLIDRLPFEGWSAATAPSPDNVWLAGKIPSDELTWFVHFDGVGWTLLPSPIEDAVVSLAWVQLSAEEPPALWIATAHALYSVSEPLLGLASAEAPKRYSLPADCSEVTSLEYTRGAFWLGCAERLFSNDPHVEPLTWPFSPMDECPLVESSETGGSCQRAGTSKEHSLPGRVDFGF